MRAAHHVSKFKGIAKEGNRVFNDHIVAQGPIEKTKTTITNKINA